MSDDVDRTNDRTAGEIDAALSMLRQAKRLAPTGLCHYCDQEIGPVKLFCDAECSESHEAEQRQRARSGRT